MRQIVFSRKLFLRCHQGGRTELESRGFEVSRDGAKRGLGKKIRDRSLKRLSVGTDYSVNAGDK